MRFVLMSDTHLRQGFDVPQGDAVLHAGDATFRGDRNEVCKFLSWYGSLPHKHKVFVAGNHDWGFQTAAPLFRDLAREFGVTYLQDESYFIGGFQVYGSPWQPEFFDWAFNLPRGEELAEKWAAIPDDTEILITHGPPKGVLDRTLPYNMRPPQNVGCWDLAERVQKLPALRLHVFGHIHPGYGLAEKEIAGRKVLFANASICDEDYAPTNAPLVVDL